MELNKITVERYIFYWRYLSPLQKKTNEMADELQVSTTTLRTIENSAIKDISEIINNRPGYINKNIVQYIANLESVYNLFKNNNYDKAKIYIQELLNDTYLLAFRIAKAYDLSEELVEKTFSYNEDIVANSYDDCIENIRIIKEQILDLFFSYLETDTDRSIILLNKNRIRLVGLLLFLKNKKNINSVVLM